MRKTLWVLMLGLALVAVPAAQASDDVIRHGVDTWTTVSSGMTFTSFNQDPLPADFFCPGSKPFTGKVAFRGAKLATEPASALPAIDTIVERMDDARLDKDGVGYSRIRLLALSLASVEPVDTGCGLFNVAVRLDGAQPTTDMKIVRTTRYGGFYVSPLALNVKVRFEPVNGDAKLVREVSRQISLGPGTRSVWSYAQEDRYTGRLLVDTNGDGKADTILPPASNFLAGVEPAASYSSDSASLDQTATYYYSESAHAWQQYDNIRPIQRLCPYTTCHCNPDPSTWDPHDPGSGCSSSHMHCTQVWITCEAVAVVAD
ncbi:MAG: hypothetical protein U0002_19295 [Thermoanaerobaculia bacterium]